MKRKLQKYETLIYGVLSSVMLTISSVVTSFASVPDSGGLLDQQSGFVNLLVYIAQYGTKYGWIFGVALLVASCFIGNDKAKQTVRGTGIAVFIGFFLCVVFTTAGADKITSTFDTITGFFK